MTTAIYESLTEYCFKEEDKNDKKWYEKYILNECIRFASNQDEETIKELVMECHKEAKLYLEDKYNIDCCCGLTYEDIYAVLLEKWTLVEHEEDLQNYKVEY